MINLYLKYKHFIHCKYTAHDVVESKINYNDTGPNIAQTLHIVQRYSSRYSTTTPMNVILQLRKQHNHSKHYKDVGYIN